MKKYIIIAFLLILFIGFLKNILLLGSIETCAKFDKVTYIRGGKNYSFSYKIFNETHHSIIYPEALKTKSLGDLKKIKCVKVKVSRFINNIALIVDDRIIKK